jgi:hypothetical protein
MRSIKKSVPVLLSIVFLASCQPKIKEFSVTSGTADFTKYIAVGNSLFAGYADGALYHSAQQNSIPNLIAGRLKLAGSGLFVQPVVISEYGVSYPGSPPKLKLSYSTDCTGATSLLPVPDIGTKDPMTPVGYKVDNLAIPGAKSFHLLIPAYALFNPYYYRFASSLDAKVVDDIPPLNATFFTIWLGDNDVLSYAVSGGQGDTITSPGYFQACMEIVLQTLTTNGAKGVISTIPDVTTIPFFTTVPYNGLELDQKQADTINYAMNLFQLPFRYHEGANPFLVNDPVSPHPYFKVRQMVAGELVLLTVPQDSLKCGGMGIISSTNFKPYPIPSRYVLTSDEVDKTRTATAAYNQIIRKLSSDFDLALVDMNSKLAELQTGLAWDGVHLETTFVSGGAFSLDGIHLTSLGNAFAANFIIEAINGKFSSTIPFVDVSRYHGVLLP